jgi:integrase
VRTEIGTTASEHAVRRAFKKAICRAGLSERSWPRDLRHTNAMQTLASSVRRRVAADRLGHARPSVTLDIYTHSVPSLQADAANGLAQLLGDNGAAG